jgi:hypothetical protein
MRAVHHQRAKVPPVPEVMECTQLVVPLYQSIALTRPTTGILTLRKVTTPCQLMVPSSSSDNDLSLVKHDTRVDLNPDGTRIRYTQEPALVSDSPSPSPPCYIVLGQRVGALYGKVLIYNPNYKGKGLHRVGLIEPDTKGAVTSSSSKDLQSTRNDAVH